LDSEAWKASAAPWKLVTVERHADLASAALMAHRLAQSAPGQVEGHGGRRELADVVDRQRGRRSLTVAIADSGTCRRPSAT
jgi:predicted ATPase with chaperone activity